MTASNEARVRSDGLKKTIPRILSRKCLRMRLASSTPSRVARIWSTTSGAEIGNARRVFH